MKPKITLNKEIKKVIKNIVGQGYKLKAQHSNPEWRKALEETESLLIDKRTLDNLDDYYIDELIDIRKKAREHKDWETSDKIRDYLDTKSVIIMDTKEGQVVYYEKSGTTRDELIEKINREKRAESLHEAWLYSIRESIKSKKKEIKATKVKVKVKNKIDKLT